MAKERDHDQDNAQDPVLYTVDAGVKEEIHKHNPAQSPAQNVQYMVDGLHGPSGVRVLLPVASDDDHELESAPVHVHNMVDKRVLDALVK